MMVGGRIRTQMEALTFAWRMLPLPLRKEGKGGGGGDKDVEAFTVGRARKAFYFSLAV